MTSVGSLSVALRNAISGMQATQTALETSSNNIANARNPDYHRQRVNLSSRAIVGRTAGVKIDSITRIVNRFLTEELTGARAQRAQLEILNSFFERIQNLFGTVSSDNSIARRITKVADKMESLVTTPAGLSEQGNAISAIQGFIDHIRNLATDIQGLRQEADQQIGNSVAAANEQITLINELNFRISRMHGGRQPAGALEDQRDAAIAKLAEEIDVVTFTRPATGEVVVLTKSGRTLVDRSAMLLRHDSAIKLSAEVSHADGNIGGIVLNDEDITNNITGGRLQALISMRDTILPNLRAEIDQLSGTLSEELNAASNTGSGFPPPRQLVSSQIFNAADIIGTTSSLSGKVRVAVLDRTGDYIDNGFGQPDLVDLDLQSLALANGGVLTVQNVINAINSGLNKANARLDGGGRLVIEALETNHGVALDATGRSLGGVNVGTIQFASSVSVSSPRDSLNVSFGAEAGDHIFEVEGVPVHYNPSRDSLISLAARINQTDALRAVNRVGNVAVNLNAGAGLSSAAPLGGGRFLINGVAFTYDASADSLNSIRDSINNAAVWQSRAFAGRTAELGAGSAGPLTINGQTINIAADDSLDSIVNKINGSADFTGNGLAASVVEENGQFRLVISDTAGTFDTAGSDAGLLTNLGFSSRPFEVTASTTGGYLALNDSSANSRLTAADATGGLLQALGLASVDFSMTAAVAGNQLVLRKASAEPVAISDITGNLVNSMGFTASELNVPPTGSRIEVAGRSRNFSHFFGFNDLILSANGYDAYASGAFDNENVLPSATGALTFSGDGFHETVAYSVTDKLTDIVAAINGNIVLQNQGVQAMIFREGSGVRMRIVHNGGRNFLIDDNSDLLRKLDLRIDNSALSQTVRINNRFTEDTNRLPRGAFYRSDNAPAGVEAVPDGLSAAGMTLAYDTATARAGDAYRLSYDSSGGELMTVVNLRTGQSQTIEVAGLLNSEANVPGGNLINDETVNVSFNELGILVTLNKDFNRNADRITIGNRNDLAGPPSGALNLTGEATFQADGDGGIDINGLRELIAAGAYNQGSGSLTLNFNSPQSSVLNLAASAGLEFSVDNGPFSSAPSNDLDDGGSHAITIRLAGSRQILGVLTLDRAVGVVGAGSLAVQVGGSVFGQSFMPEIGENALAPGDSSVVQAMLRPFDGNVRFQRAGLQPAQNNTFSGFAANIVGLTSINAQGARTDLQAKQAFYNTLQTQQGAESGVNVNEELARIQILQASFNAASRLIRVSADLLDELINIVR